jgi:hypothetical protein
MAKLGRALLAGECSVAELRKLTKGFKTAQHYISDEMVSYVYDSVVVDGDLEIDRLDTFEHKLCCLVVTGNLRVANLYCDYDDPQTAVFVLGDLEAGSAITNGALCVAGNLIVRENLVGFYNDHSAEILGSVRARVFAPENHHFSIGGRLAADYVLGSHAQHRVSPKQMKAAIPTADSILKAVLVPEIVRGGISPSPENELDLDNTIIRTRVATGLPLLRDDAPKPTPHAAPPSKKPAAKKPAAKKRRRSRSNATTTRKP